MKSYVFSSALAPYINGLLSQKRALGYKYDVEEHVLRRFDHYWLETNPGSEEITMESLAGWTAQQPTEGKNSQSMRISVTRQLMLYMNGIGRNVYIPMDRIRRERPVVHILTLPEIQELFCMIDRYRPQRQSPEVTRMADEYKVIFRLILTTGLRRSEAATLRLTDIDWELGALRIRNAKGHKDRIVFLKEDTKKLLNEYVCAIREKVNGHTEWVFPAADPSRHLSSGALAIRFKKFWRETSFASCVVKEPTIHSLRHTYVVIRMNSWMEQGVDLELMLPYLSQALGHKSPNESFYYYHQVANAFRLIRKKDSMASTVIPEVRVR